MQKKAWLIVNGFLNSDKFNEIYEWLVEAGEKKKIHFWVRTNAEVMIWMESGYKKEQIPEGETPDFVLFWDKDIRLAMYLEAQGFLVFNSANAARICDDKSLTHLVLWKEAIPMPKTIVAPMTYENIGYTNYFFLEDVMDSIAFPIVVKECFGSFGQQVYLAENRKELCTITKKIGTKPMLFQEMIQTSFARDIRLNVVGEKVVAAMYRYSDNGDFRANITGGGHMKPYSPTEEQKQLAIQCVKVIGLDFAGVDLLFGEQDTPLVCEVNSNAHFKNIYDCTGINVADAILEHILKQM